MTYNNSQEVFLSLFPEFKLMSTYDESDLQNPYIFVSQFVPYLRVLWLLGKLSSTDHRIRELFNHLNELKATSLENEEFICTGVF